MLAWELLIRVAHAVVSRECIGTAECLLLGTDIAADFLLASIVNGIFVSCKIVRSREDSVARLSGTRVYTVAFVRSSLTVHEIG